MEKDNNKTTDNQQIISPRQKIGERLRNKDEALDIDNDDALFGAIATDYDRFDERDREREEFNDMLMRNPHASGIITGLITGKDDNGNDFDLGMYLIENYPEVIEDVVNGNPKNREYYESLRNEREKIAREDKEFEEKVEALTAAEDAELDAAIEEAGYKTDDVRDLIDWIYNPTTGIITRAKNMELKKDDFLKLFRIKDYDKNLARAENDGYVRGKNEKIDMYGHAEDKRRQLPVLGSGSGRPREREEDPMLDNLSRMKDVYINN